MFVNPFFLFLLPLAGVPVIIHMIHRQKYTVHEFSALLFFDRSRKYNVFRLHLRHVLLMILRMIAILLVLLAFARPSVIGSKIGDKRQAISFVVDCSTSMTRDFGGKSMIEHSREQVIHSIGELGAGTIVSVVSNEVPPRLVLRPTSDLDAGIESIKELECFYGPGSSWDAVQLAQASLGDVRAASRSVVVFSDMQAKWQAEAPEAMRDVPIHFVHLKQTRNENCAVIDVDVQATPISIGRPARFGPVIRNYGRQPVKNLRVTAGLVQDDTEELSGETITLDIDANSSIQLTFYLTFGVPGHHEVAFEISDPTVAADNRWTEAVSVMDTVPVLCLGKESKETTTGLFYLMRALSPSGRSSNISLVTASLDELSKMGLYGYNCVFVSGIHGLDESEAKLLTDYVFRGGGLVLFPGEGTDDASLKLLFSEKGGASLMPVGIEGLVKSTSRIDTADFQASSLGRYLTGDVTSQFKGINYNRRYRFVAGEGCRTLMTFDDGTPALLEYKHGFGRCVLFAGGCKHPDTDLQFRAVFPALMQLMATELAHPVESTTARVGAGESYIATFEKTERPVGVKVAYKRGVIDDVEVHGGAGARGYSVTYAGATRPGYYELRARYPEDDEQETVIDAFSVNTGGSDSDLGVAELGAGANQFGEMVRVTEVDSPSMIDDLLDTDRLEWMRLALLALLLLLVVENFISWRTR